MNPITKKNLLYAGVGAIVGGVVSYLIIEAVLYHLEEREYNMTYGEDDFVSPEESEVPIDYRSLTEKPPIEDLVKPYNKPEGPRIISETAALGNQWIDDEKRDYEVTYVNFYVEDQIFIDMNDNIVDDPNAMFGPNIHLHFGELAGDPDIVYVLNEKYSTIYEVIQIHDSYENFVRPPVKEEIEEDLKPERSSTRRGRRTAKKKPPKPTKKELMDETVESSVEESNEDSDET